MTFHYALYQNDYLQHQLYVDSKNPRIRNHRTNNWLIVTGCLFFVSLISYFNDNSVTAFYFLIGGIVSLLFFPNFQKSETKKQLEMAVRETYHFRFGLEINVRFHEDTVEILDLTGHLHLNLSALENIIELPNYFYLKIKSGEHLILPKAAIGPVEQIRRDLMTLGEKLKIEFISDLQWKWK